MYISVQLSLSSWSFHQERRTDSPRLDWSNTQSTQELVSLSSLNAKSGKISVKRTKQEQQQSTSAGVLTTNTKTATSFRFPELHANKLINQSLHVVDLNIDRYDTIIGRDFIRYLGIDIHGADMTIHWDDAAIPWHDIDSTTNDVFALSQYNAPFNSETKRMINILKPILKPSQKAPRILILKK